MSKEKLIEKIEFLITDQAQSKKILIQNLELTKKFQKACKKAEDRKKFLKKLYYIVEEKQRKIDELEDRVCIKLDGNDI